MIIVNKLNSTVTNHWYNEKFVSTHKKDILNYLTVYLPLKEINLYFLETDLNQVSITYELNNLNLTYF